MSASGFGLDVVQGATPQSCGIPAAPAGRLPPLRGTCFLGSLPCDTHGPFPRETVRDLLGLVRSLYRGELAAPPPRADKRKVEQLEKIGKRFRLSLELAAKCGPGTLGRRAAWDHAEAATADLGEFVQMSEPLTDAVLATKARMLRRG